jgi:hypothetical protein
MTSKKAQRLVQQYFQHLGQESPKTLYNVIDGLCGCFYPLPKTLRREYPETMTYHDLWREILTDATIEGSDPADWLPRLYPLYVRDRAAWGDVHPSKVGFTSWLGEMVDEDDVQTCLQSWPPPSMLDRTQL